MEMVATLVDYSVDTSARVDVPSCFQGSTCRAVQRRKRNRYSVGYSLLVRRSRRSQSVDMRSKVKIPVTPKGGGLHHASPLRLTKQKGKVKAYKTNIHSHIQSGIVQFELHHDIKKDIQIQSLTIIRLQMSDYVQIVDLGNCGFK